MRRRSLFSIDLLIVGSVFLLTVIGILFIYSGNTDSAGNVRNDEFLRQIVWALAGLVLVFFFAFYNYLHLRDYSLVIYLVFLGILLITLLVGRVINEARSWLGIGIFGIQPSEFTKIATILFLGNFLVRTGARIRELPYFLLAFLICLGPIALILLQPDMGTALVYIPIFISMVWMAGTKRRYIIFLMITGFLTILIGIIPELQKYFFNSYIPILSIFTDTNHLLIFSGVIFIIGLLSFLGYFFFREPYYYWIMYGSAITVLSSLGALAARKVLQDYQIKRLLIFLNPMIDPKKYGWNIINSVTAVGSGGFFGKGFRMGTQSQLKYLPQQSNDFIFSIIAEEWGFVGGLIVFALFLVILFRSIRIIQNSSDPFAQYVGAGIIGMILYHCIVNIGMTMGLMPVTGIPLFFVSYGGSSLLTGMISIGIILNIYFRRYT
jgi:rod shape determining protein RodA